MMRVSPAARKSKFLSAALNVTSTDPLKPVMSVLTEVVSADASTVLSPLGSVSPADQVIEKRLALTALGFKSVKPRLAAGAISSVVLPVVCGDSMIGCSPVSAASTGGGGLGWATSRAPELCATEIAVDTGNASLFASWANLIAWKSE